jgi:hypothetical protein
MGVVANMKQIGATRPFDAAQGITTLGLTSFDTVTGALTIPATGTMFYVNFGTSTSYEITSLSSSICPGRKVVLMVGNGSDTFDFTGTAVASFPGTTGQMFVDSASVSLSFVGASLAFKQIATGAWVQVSQTTLS